MKLKLLACRIWLLGTLGVGSLAVGTVRADPAPSLKSNDLAHGPYSSMHMLLEKTFLKVDVLTVDVRFGKSAHARLAKLARGKAYSEALGKEAAKIAISADDALVQLRFVRDVSLDQWMDGVRENLQQARDAGLISKKTQQRVGQGLPSWFAPLAERGYIVIAPAYPLMANYQPDLKALGYQSGTMKAIHDNIRALDLLETLPFVRKGKYGVIGHSLGGHNAIFTAIFDPRICVVVCSCGFDSFLDYYHGDPANWQPGRGWCQERYMPRLADYRGKWVLVSFWAKPSAARRSRSRFSAANRLLCSNIRTLRRSASIASGR